MPGAEFGGKSTQSVTDDWVESGYFGMSQGRTCSDGVKRLAIYHLNAYLGGVDQTRTFKLIYTSQTATLVLPGGDIPQPPQEAETTNFAVTERDPATLHGADITGDMQVITNPSGAFTVRADSNGKFRFLRGANGSGSAVDAAGTTWSGDLGVQVFYYLPPLAPEIVSLTPSNDGKSTTVKARYDAFTPGYDGGTPLVEYTYQRSTSPSFSTNVQTIQSTQDEVIFTGLTSGTKYYYRVCLTNEVTRRAGVLGGAWSPISSLVQPNPDYGYSRVYRSGAWQPGDGKVYRGASLGWVELAGRRWNGTSWVKIGN